MKGKATMKLKFHNDWRYLFWKDAVGGRFASFCFIYIGYMRGVDTLVNGFTITLLGIGVRITR